MLSDEYAAIDLHREVTARRSRVDLYSPAEIAIRNAVIEVEKVGAHPMLTNVVAGLARCQDELQKYLLADKQPVMEVPDWPPARSAVGLRDGDRDWGSTGQLFEVKDGRWIRVNIEPGLYSPSGHKMNIRSIDPVTGLED